MRTILSRTIGVLSVRVKYSGKLFRMDPSSLDARMKHDVVRDVHELETRLIVGFRRLAAQAFRSVLNSKQTSYQSVVRWLDECIRDTTPSAGKEVWKLGKAMRQGNDVFRHYRY